MNLVPAAVLMAPEMAVTAVGDTLHVTFDELPLTAVVMVTVWKTGEDLQVPFVPFLWWF